MDSSRIAAGLKSQRRNLLPAVAVRSFRPLLPAAVLAALIITLLPLAGACGDAPLFLDEEFNSLANWKPLYFPKIKAHTDYKTVKESSNSLLMLSSNSSASALILKKSFHVRDYPVISWRWKVENVYKRGDGGRKEGDDFPVRVYVIFDYDPEKAGIFRRAKYKMAKLVYGEYPPDSTISFVWASRAQGEKIIRSPFTKRAMIVRLDSSDAELDRWKTHTVNIVSWYKKAFGKPPPRGKATLAVMNDSDNTGESSVSYIDFIRIGKAALLAE